jgi:transcription elongation GreA/GreB family factor
MKINKAEVLRQLVAQLEGALTAAQMAAEVAHDAATNEESISEDKHDTRSIEAGYLAGAQRKRVAEIKELINYFKILKPKEFIKREKISATALVHVGIDGKNAYYFLVPQGGGLETVAGKLNVKTVSPQTPLGEALLGLGVGETASVLAKGLIREYEILDIC